MHIKIQRLSVFLFILLLFSACSSSNKNIQIPPTFTATIIPKSTITPIPTITNTSTTPSTNTPTSTATLIPTSTPTEDLREEISPEAVSFPVSWDGTYKLSKSIQYAPCYHYDKEGMAKAKNLTDNIVYNYFHAGDMYNLNSNNPVREFTILAPAAGEIINISKMGNGNGVMVVIKTNLTKDSKPVFISIAHLTSEFPGDDSNPLIKTGSIVTPGQPIGIQKTMFKWGISEQALDIQFRLNPTAEGYPLDESWNPDDFIDPFPYLEDDLVSLVKEKHVVYGRNRSHCLLSGHFPK